jgi:hypothetical protein
MMAFLSNKNLFYFWLSKWIGKDWALSLANTIEKAILISLGRETAPYSIRNGLLNREPYDLGGIYYEY